VKRVYSQGRAFVCPEATVFLVVYDELLKEGLRW
jgi:hypothetical protein